MRLYKTIHTFIVEAFDQYYLLKDTNWDQLINRDNLYGYIHNQLSNLSVVDAAWKTSHTILVPIGSQEVWAAGVTYLRSRDARKEESKDSGGGDFYDKVYDARRPELFFKSQAHRCLGSGEKVRIRKDSQWNVPEPELTLFINSNGSIEGYTVGNDMSSRDIEGENPLYLPQAKMYDGSAAIGPCLYIPSEPISKDARIQMEIIREGQQVFSGHTTLAQMKRTHTELVAYLFMEMSFDTGVFLMTGTGLVPPDSFTLKSNDEIRISIGDIGTLINTVA